MPNSCTCGASSRPHSVLLRYSHHGEAVPVQEALGEAASRVRLCLPSAQACLQELLGVLAADDVDLVDLLEAALSTALHHGIAPR